MSKRRSSFYRDFYRDFLRSSVIDRVLTVDLNGWIWITGAVCFARGNITSDVIHSLVGSVMMLSVFVCDVLEHRNRVNERSHQYESLTDETGRVYEHPESTRSIDIAPMVTKMPESHEYVGLLPVHNCNCVYCKIKRYDRDGVSYLTIYADEKPVRVIREETRYDVPYEDDFT